MSIFGITISSVPGNSKSVSEIAYAIQAQADSIETVADTVFGTEKLAPTWIGLAADAYFDAKNGEILNVQRLCYGLANGSKALNLYASSISSYKSLTEDLQYNLQTLEEQVQKNTNPTAYALAYATNLAKALDIAEDYTRYLENLKTEAQTCAAKLTEALHLEPVNLDKKGRNVGSLNGLSRANSDQILADMQDPNYYLKISQNKIGDCYYLASIIALLHSPNREQWLENTIKPAKDENGTITGFFVTLKDKNGKDQTVYVDSYYQYGVQNTNGINPDGTLNTYPGLISVLEAAYGQIHKGGTKNSDHGGITSGFAIDALEDLGQVKVKEEGNHHGINIGGITNWMGLTEIGYTDEQHKAIIKASSHNQPLTASTGSTPDHRFNDDTAVVDATVEDGAVKLKVSNSHAYAVTNVGKETVTLINPWGYNKLDNDIKTPDGQFTVSWETYNKYFTTTTIVGGN